MIAKCNKSFEQTQITKCSNSSEHTQKCSPWKWRNKRRNMQEKRWYLIHVFYCIWAFCWCIRDIPFRNVYLEWLLEYITIYTLFDRGTVKVWVLIYRDLCSSTVVCIICPWLQTFAVFCMLYVFFWAIPRRLNFICWRFGTLCLFHLHRQVGVLYTYLPVKMEQTECLNFICQRFGTPCLFHLHRQVDAQYTYLPMKMEQTGCSETLAYKIQTLCLFHLHRQVGV